MSSAALAIVEPNAESNVESPGERIKTWRFTSANAAEMARRGHAANRRRKELAAKYEAERQASANVIPHTERVELVREQIARTRQELNKNIEPKERAALLLGLDRLMDRERILAGIPLPGQRRPGREKPERRGTASPFESCDAAPSQE